MSVALPPFPPHGHSIGLVPFARKITTTASLPGLHAPNAGPCCGTVSKPSPFCKDQSVHVPLPVRHFAFSPCCLQEKNELLDFASKSLKCPWSLELYLLQILCLVEHSLPTLCLRFLFLLTCDILCLEQVPPFPPSSPGNFSRSSSDITGEASHPPPAPRPPGNISHFHFLEHKAPRSFMACRRCHLVLGPHICRLR